MASSNDNVSVLPAHCVCVCVCVGGGGGDPHVTCGFPSQRVSNARLEVIMLS